MLSAVYGGFDKKYGEISKKKIDCMQMMYFYKYTNYLYIHCN